MDHSQTRSRTRNRHRGAIHEVATHELQPIRFGEFLRELDVISDEDLLCALADHWSNGGRFGAAITRLGMMKRDDVERYAEAYHGLHLVVVDDARPGCLPAVYR